MFVKFSTQEFKDKMNELIETAPQLTGVSEKQIKYGEKMRKGFIQEVFAKISSTFNGTQMYKLTTSNNEEDKAKIQEIKNKTIELVQTLEAMLQQITDAKYWIEVTEPGKSWAQEIKKFQEGGK